MPKNIRSRGSVRSTTGSIRLRLVLRDEDLGVVDTLADFTTAADVSRWETDGHKFTGHDVAGGGWFVVEATYTQGGTTTKRTKAVFIRR